jgi:hypothetical protein
MNGLLKRLISLAIVLVVSAPANARPDARAMTCAQVQALLASARAATLTTGPNTYARFVAPGACDGTGVGLPATIVTKDDNLCAVYTCGARVRRTR